MFRKLMDKTASEVTHTAERAAHQVAPNSRFAEKVGGEAHYRHFKAFAHDCTCNNSPECCGKQIARADRERRL